MRGIGRSGRIGLCRVAGAALVALAALEGVTACRSPEPPPTPPPAAEPPPAPVEPTNPVNKAEPDKKESAAPRKFGAPIEAASVMSLASVMSKPDEFANRTVTVEAKVRRNCTRRGCWMELSESLEPSAPGCRVTFKDYGFFVPLDSAGSTAKVQGTVEVKTVAATEVEHLESEGAKFAGKQPDGTAREVRMVATGVELRRGS